jgi:creatinine amidohydrolase
MDNELLVMTGHRLSDSYYDKAVLPIGSTEYHGEHLPFGTDTLVADSLASAVAERIDGMLKLPALPYGMSHHYSSLPMVMTLETETLNKVLKEIMDSLNKHGVKRLLVVNGHDGNIPALEAAAREYRTEHPEFKVAALETWWITAGDLLPKGTFEVWGGLGHAGEGETSMMLRVAPELVNMSKARGHIPALPKHVQVKWLFKEITPYGVTGDPTKATSEKGILMWDALVDHLTAFVQEMDNNGWEVDKQTNA